MQSHIKDELIDQPIEKSKLNIYAAGIYFENKELNLDQKIDLIIKTIAEIKNDAGLDAIILIVLHEYALTPQAISNQAKKECLSKLKDEIQKCKNVILIPGSFSSYKTFNELSDPAEKQQKVQENYNNFLLNPYNLINPGNLTDIEFMREYQNSQSIDQSVLLQNISPIIYSDGILKHMKLYPFLEGDKLINNANYCYTIGGDNPIKDINGISIGLTICREAFYPFNKERNNSTILQVLMSDWIDVKEYFNHIKENFYGAVTIHMDSRHGLNIYINDKHPKLGAINELKSCLYVLDRLTNQTKKYMNGENEFLHFSRDLKEDSENIQKKLNTFYAILDLFSMHCKSFLDNNKNDELIHIINQFKQEIELANDKLDKLPSAIAAIRNFLNKCGKEDQFMNFFKNGNTVVHNAVIHEHFDALKFLLAEGVNPFIPDNNGRSAFYLCLERKYLHFAMEILNAQKIDPNFLVNGVCEALVFSIRNKNEFIKEWIKSNIQLAMKDTHGNTLLHHAILRNDNVLVKTLLEFGSDPSIANNYGHNPIYLALYNNNINCAIEMVKTKKIDLNILVSGVYNAIVLCINNNHTHIQEWIKNYIGLTMKDSDENTFLHHAVLTNNISVINFLICNHPAITTIQNGAGQTAIAYALINNKVEAYNALSKAGVAQNDHVYVNQNNQKSETVLEDNENKDHPEVARILEKNSAINDRTICDHKKNTVDSVNQFSVFNKEIPLNNASEIGDNDKRVEIKFFG